LLSSRIKGKEEENAACTISIIDNNPLLLKAFLADWFASGGLGDGTWGHV